MSKPARRHTPTLATLRKYGLTIDDFKHILEAQGGVCAICGKVPNGGWNIDHDHRKGWRKFPPEKRAKHVRGILCWFCNKYYVGRCITVEKAQNVVAYLKSYQERIMTK
jgi:hypothetical protein